MLVKSWGAKCLAVRKVTQDNQGKKTAGVDGVKSLTPVQRLKLVENLKVDSKAENIRRIWIPKPRTTEKRPLGIPTLRDRATQALLKMALEPEWEALFEPNSYGFRPGRSCSDAREAIFSYLRYKPKYVLETDINKCFDRINHEALLNKLNTAPTFRRQIRAWLKAGVMEKGNLFQTKEGTPQGGVISPLLANIALHGLENLISNEFLELAKNQRVTWFHPKGTHFNPPVLIRYADDLIVLHEELRIVQKCQELIAEWLKDMNLEMKPSKTRISHTHNEYNGKIGFDFLGFNARQYQVGKHHSARNPKKELLGFSTIIKPSEGSIKGHLEEVTKTIDAHKNSPQAALISDLNPIIRGWSNYHSTGCSRDTFHKLDYILFQKLRAWAVLRHPNKNKHQIFGKYWKSVNPEKWIFGLKTKDETIRLQKYSETHIERHVKIKGNWSPYDGNLTYWSKRLGNHPLLGKRQSTLLKKQKGKCPHCNMLFMDNSIWEIHHKDRNRNNNKYSNLLLVHKHCHDKIHAKAV
jgi:RNA-directed DNA polymerase